MPDWISTVFESNADKARLIAIIISSIVAVSILLLNQKLSSGRERKKLLIEKIEAISRHISNFDRTSWNYLFDNASDSIKNLSAATEALDEIEILLNLYFPNFIFINSTEIIHKIELMKKSIPDTEHAKNLSFAIEARKFEHKNLMKDLRDERKVLMEKYGHKIT